MSLIPEVRWFQMEESSREALRQQLRQQLMPHTEILFAYLLGSFQQGLPFRDIDVAVYLKPAFLQSTDTLTYCFKLADELERAVGYPIDVNLLNNASCGFCYNATRGILLLSRDEPLRHEWVAQIWREYLDFEPHLISVGRAWVRQLGKGETMDTRVLIKRIGSMLQNLGMVRQIMASEAPQSLLGDVYKVAALKWYLLLAIEDAFALCSHAVAELGGDAPTSYAECFETLWEHGLIEESLRDRLRMMARFRNLLVHRYWDVDDSRVLDICQNHLGDLEKLALALSDRFGLGV